MKKTNSENILLEILNQKLNFLNVELKGLSK